MAQNSKGPEGTPMPYWEDPASGTEEDIQEKKYTLDSHNWKDPSAAQQTFVEDSSDFLDDIDFVKVNGSLASNGGSMGNTKWMNQGSSSTNNSGSTTNNNSMNSNNFTTRNNGSTTGNNSPATNNRSMNQGGSTTNNGSMSQGGSTGNNSPMNNNNFMNVDRSSFSLAMAYVPHQEWGNLYAVDVGFQRGTIFPDLDKPFIGEGENS